jgi:D-beta-D-heptose 7-phosphate kinase/D-beta-D-heptose 1-phosphate adenosyltransferase
MDLVQQLILRDQETRKRILVVGDSMEDVWVTGHVTSSQDHCLTFWEETSHRTPGGAANAARALHHWNAEVKLLSLLPLHTSRLKTPAWQEVDEELCLESPSIITKRRYLDGDHILFRADHETDVWQDQEEFEENRRLALLAMEHGRWHGVLIADYAKGFLDEVTIRALIHIAQQQGAVVVADPKRHPDAFSGAVLKCNGAYALAHPETTSHVPSCVVTFGDQSPLVYDEEGQFSPDVPAPDARCVNHVGAGDCFGAHLALALTHGFLLREAVEIAHCAGMAYVANERSRPLWPFEVRRQHLGLLGKVIDPEGLPALAKAIRGKVVFTNGVFRLPHAGHAWLLDWARQQGDVLVVGVNNACSAYRQKPEQFVMPLEERLQMLCAMKSVDWVVPFSQDTPREILEVLKPNILVKGPEYEGQEVPGCDLVQEVRFPFRTPYPDLHCSSLVEKIREK